MFFCILAQSMMFSFPYKVLLLPKHNQLFHNCILVSLCFSASLIYGWYETYRLFTYHLTYQNISVDKQCFPGYPLLHNTNRFASTCLCCEVKGNAFYSVVEMWHPDLLSSVLSFLSPGQLWLPFNQWQFALFVTSTFYCVFQLTQQDWITAV